MNQNSISSFMPLSSKALKRAYNSLPPYIKVRNSSIFKIPKTETNGLLDYSYYLSSNSELTEDVNIKKYKLLKVIYTKHSFTDPDIFLPRISDVYAQIPKDYIDKGDIFVFQKATNEQLLEKGLDGYLINGYHIARIEIYRKKFLGIF